MMKFCIVAVLACASSVVQAQTRAGFPWWNSPVTREIGLTPEQEAKIHQTVQSYRNRLLDARNNVLKAQGEMEDVLNSSEIDPNRAKAAIETLTSSQAASRRTLLEMSVQLRSVLTLDQWRQLVRRWGEMQRKRPSDTQVAP